ncbi:MAG TPA: hypothetical protein VGP94_15280, partial [Tepidisphaeraceae bacterium]|nr:hypothetical protein [Tepidisphaeraceae bacterium]
VKHDYISQHKFAGARMKQNWTWIFLLALALCSCDKPRPTGSAQPTTEDSSDEPDFRPRPPMQLERTIRPADYPLQIRVPERWEMRYGGVNILQGPTPHGPKPDGVIHLTITRRSPLPKMIVDALKTSSTKPTTKDSSFRDEMRTLGKLQVYEQRSTESSAKGPARIKWTISVFEPIDKDNVRLYQISFLDLTRDHFEKDRELLESMIASLAPAEEEGPSLK